MATQAQHAASLESAVRGGQPTFDIRNTRDHFQQRPVDIAEALNCPPLAAMLNPNLALHLATAGHGFQVSALAFAASGESSIPAQLGSTAEDLFGAVAMEGPLSVLSLAFYVCMLRQASMSSWLSGAAQGPLGPQPLSDLAAKALRKALSVQLQSIAAGERQTLEAALQKAQLSHAAVLPLGPVPHLPPTVAHAPTQNLLQDRATCLERRADTPIGDRRSLFNSHWQEVDDSNFNQQVPLALHQHGAQLACRLLLPAANFGCPGGMPLTDPLRNTRPQMLQNDSLSPAGLLPAKAQLSFGLHRCFSRQGRDLLLEAEAPTLQDSRAAWGHCLGLWRCRTVHILGPEQPGRTVGSGSGDCSGRAACL